MRNFPFFLLSCALLLGATNLTFAQAPSIAPLEMGAEINLGALLTAPPANAYQSDLRCDPLDLNRMSVTAKNGNDEKRTVAWNTRDGGKNWTVERQELSSDPDVIYNQQGDALWTYIDKSNGNKTSLRRLAAGEQQWQKPQLISQDAIDHAHLAVDRTQSAWSGSVYLAGRVFHQNVVDVIRSRDGGATWTTTRVDVGPQVGQGFVQGPPCVMRDGTLVVFLTSQNDILADENGRYAGNRRGIYVIRSRDGGASFEAPVRVAPYNSPANAGPGFSRAISGGAVEIAGGERLIVVYNQTREKQNAQLQMSISDDAGATWSEPRVLALALPPNWAPGAMSLMFNRAGVIGLQFFGIAPDARYDLFFSFSRDGGANWSEPARVSTATSSAPAERVQPRELGGDQICGDAAADGSFRLVWTDNRDGDNDYQIYLRSVSLR